MAVDALATARFALDVKGLDGLKRAAVADPQSQLKEAARQFEAVFMANMLKSMRAATVKSNLVDNRQIDFYQSMLDQQLSQQMAGKGPGLAKLLVRQLSRRAGDQSAQQAAVAAQMAAIPRGAPRSLAGVPAIPAASNDPDPVTPARAAATRARSVVVAARPAPTASAGDVDPTADADGDSVYDRFVNRFASAARAAAQRSGLPTVLILAQAALESGWGQHEVTGAGGTKSHNLFGVKAGAGWHGATASNDTREYASGEWTRIKATFRAYRSYLDSFLDHARLIGSSPRYAAVQNAATPEQAARALQDAGYATDPAYADKLISIMREINRTGAMSQGNAGRAQAAVLTADNVNKTLGT